MNMDAKFKEVTEIVNSAGGTPFPVTDTLVSIIKLIVAEDELDFIMSFKEKKSQTMEQLMENSGLSEAEILDKVGPLADKGVIFDQPNRKGIIVYRLLPLINVGTFEYTFMKKLEINERTRQLSALFSKLFEEAKSTVREGYDNLAAFLETIPPIDRTVPIIENKATGKTTVIQIDEDLGATQEKYVPTQRVEELIEKFDEIAVGHCFCRHHRDVEGKPCQQTDLRENCFTFGKSARFTSSHGFSRMISKEEALKILKLSEKDGLVHKAYHPNFDTSKDETSICNCCKCCCGNSAVNLVMFTANAAHYVAVVDENVCTGCGTCVDECHTDAIFLNDNGTASHKEELCIGCGVCSYFCPENAIQLVEKDRILRFMIPKA